MNQTPQDLSAEISVLGAILYDNNVLNDVTGLIAPEDFYKAAHQKIYSAILDLSAKQLPIDIISLNNYLKNKDILEECGDTPYLAMICSSVCTSAFTLNHSKIIKEKALLRRVISLGYELSESAQSFTGDIAEFLEHAESTIYRISSEKDKKNSFLNSRELVKKGMKIVEKRFYDKKSLTGVSTGLIEIDKLTSGLQNSDMIILAARPSMGKTALALNIALNSAFNGVPIAFLSLEMSKEQLMIRALSSLAKVPNDYISTGFLSTDQYAKIVAAAQDLSEIPFFIDDTGALPLVELRSRCRKIKAKENIGLFVIDYLQQIVCTKKTGSREQEVSEISKGIKALAKELDVPILLLSQLNRSVESRPDKRPVLSDLRDSGSIEQDADIVMFIYRDEVYKKDSADKGVAEILIRKHRNGRIGTVELQCELATTTFRDLYRQQTRDRFNDSET